MADRHEQVQRGTAIRRPERLAETVYARVLDIIVRDRLAMGDKLPTEHALAEMFGVSRPVVREALGRLRSDGIIDARQGSGSFLCRPAPSRLMSHMQPAHISSGLAAYEVRLALETATARLAAENRTKHDLSLVERQLAKFEKQLNSGKNAFGEDLLLHRAIAAATGNPLFLSTFDYLTAQMQEVMTAILSMTQEDSDKRRLVITKEHRAIVKAIAARNGTAAASAMEHHLQSARRRAIDGFEPGT